MFQVLFLFHNFLQNSLQKLFQSFFSFFYEFTETKIKSALKPSQQVHFFFSINQNNAWTIRELVDETNDPATQRTILNIVGFYIIAYVELHWTDTVKQKICEDWICFLAQGQHSFLFIFMCSTPITSVNDDAWPDNNSFACFMATLM